MPWGRGYTADVVSPVVGQLVGGILGGWDEKKRLKGLQTDLDALRSQALSEGWDEFQLRSAYAKAHNQWDVDMSPNGASERELTDYQKRVADQRKAAAAQKVVSSYREGMKAPAEKAQPAMPSTSMNVTRGGAAERAMQFPELGPGVLNASSVLPQASVAPTAPVRAALPEGPLPEDFNPYGGPPLAAQMRVPAWTAARPDRLGAAADRVFAAADHSGIMPVYSSEPFPRGSAAPLEAQGLPGVNVMPREVPQEEVQQYLGGMADWQQYQKDLADYEQQVREMDMLSALGGSGLVGPEAIASHLLTRQRDAEKEVLQRELEEARKLAKKVEPKAPERQIAPDGTIWERDSVSGVWSQARVEGKWPNKTESDRGKLTDMRWLYSERERLNAIPEEQRTPQEVENLINIQQEIRRRGLGVPPEFERTALSLLVMAENANDSKLPPEVRDQWATQYANARAAAARKGVVLSTVIGANGEQIVQATPVNPDINVASQTLPAISSSKQGKGLQRALEGQERPEPTGKGQVVAVGAPKPLPKEEAERFASAGKLAGLGEAVYRGRKYMGSVLQWPPGKGYYNEVKAKYGGTSAQDLRDAVSAISQFKLAVEGVIKGVPTEADIKRALETFAQMNFSPQYSMTNLANVADLTAKGLRLHLDQNLSGKGVSIPAGAKEIILQFEDLAKRARSAATGGKSLESPGIGPSGGSKYERIQ